MDKFTFLAEDLDALASAGLTDEETGLVMLAMARYAMSGSEPDFGDKAGPRIAFAMLRARLDKYIRKCETNAANGQSGGRPPKTRPEAEQGAEETKGNPTETENNPTETQPEATETYDYDYEYEQEQGEKTVSPERENTHNQTAGRVTRGRAREGWFDPAHPEAVDDGAWRWSEAARKSVAQRIITYGRSQLKLWDQTRNTEAGPVGRGLFDAVTEALGLGIPPSEILALARGSTATWVWELRVKEAVISQGGTLNYPEWVDQLAELRDEMDEITRPPAAAYA